MLSGCVDYIDVPNHCDRRVCDPRHDFRALEAPHGDADQAGVGRLRDLPLPMKGAMVQWHIAERQNTLV